MNQHETNNDMLNQTMPRMDYKSNLERQQEISHQLRQENATLRAQLKKAEDLLRKTKELTHSAVCSEVDAYFAEKKP